MTKNIFARIFCGILTLAASAGGHAQTTGMEAVITGVAVSGLKRTKQGTAETPLKQFIGARADTLDIDAVYAAVLDTGILEPLAITVTDEPYGNGKILSVTVREKWSIFPLPVFFAGSGGVNGGVFFVDTNAFGLNDKFFLGGMYSADGWMFISGYMHSTRKGLPGWNISGSFERDERSYVSQREEDIRRFAIDSGGVSAGVSYPFTEKLTARLQLSYREAALRELEAALRAPDSGARVFETAAEVSARKSGWDGFLLSEETLSAGYGFNIEFTGSLFHQLSLRGTYQKPLFPGFRVNLNAGFLYQPDVPALFEAPPRAAQVNILPWAFHARHYAGASAGLEKYLFKMSMGTVSASAAYQIVFSEGPVLGKCFDHGPAFSVVFYLSRLAIPAMGLDFAYNAAAGKFLFSFRLGMSF